MKKENAKAWQAEKKERKEKLLTTSDWLQLLQTVFNEWVRFRDAGLECVSCGCDMRNRKGNASHYFSVGSYPNLRIDEDNVHNGCVPCNQHKGGNLIEYGLRLPLRIGQERFEALKERRQQELKLTLPEIKELILDYRNRIRELKKKD